jgi:chaperone BCS1
LTLLGKNKQILFDLLTEAAELALKEEKGYTIIYTPHGHEWKIFGTPRLHRPFDSVILNHRYYPQNLSGSPFFLIFRLSDNIYEDVKNFLESPSWYVERGIPYRRGYLLHGPPGTGKSSFIQALAGIYKFCGVLQVLISREITIFYLYFDPF